MKGAFLKHELRTWHWHCKLDFLIGAYCALEKALARQTRFLDWRLTRFRKGIGIANSIFGLVLNAF